MSIINFPSSPTTNQTYTVGSKTWIWNGYAWDLQLSSAGFSTANGTIAWNTANAAFIQANTPSYVANSAAIYANGAFAAANVANSNAITAGSYANSAFVQANVSAGVDLTQNNSISAAFLQANTPSYVANSAAIYANGAFAAANAANNNAIAAGNYANAAFAAANSSTGTQGAYNTANAAFIQANTPSYVANSAAIYANGAFAAANAANNNAITAGSYANSAFIRANTPSYVANSAFIQANAAFIRANSGANAEVQTLSTVADGTSSTYALGFTPTSNTGVFVSIGGIVQTEIIDYTITTSNNTISFTDPPPANERIRVAGFNNVIPYYLDVANSAGAMVVSYNGVGDGVTQGFNIGFRPDSGNTIFVSIGGILQPENAFTVNPATNTVTFITAPQSGENIRVVGYNKVNPYYIQYVSSNVSVSTFETTANGNYTTFNIGFLPQAREVLIVSIDGVIQPITSYTVDNTQQTITFDDAPANNELVRVITMYTTANAFITPDASITTIKLAPNVTGNINGSFAKANLAFDQANAAFITANAAATTGKAIAMSIVFGG